MAKNYNPPPSINPETVRLMGDAKKKEAEMLVRIDAIRFALEVMKESENNLDGIIAEAAKIERFIEFGSVPPKMKK
tara:strand:+ start:1747 stop:1974 length:228 start_codon:yes stop_codon:yes gene_type:complete